MTRKTRCEGSGTSSPHRQLDRVLTCPSTLRPAMLRRRACSSGRGAAWGRKPLSGYTARGVTVVSIRTRSRTRQDNQEGDPLP